MSKNIDSITKFDEMINTIPIRNKKIINLMDGTIRLRNKDDFFTYEMDFDYLGKSDDCTPLANKYFMEIATEKQYLYQTILPEYIFVL